MWEANFLLPSCRRIGGENGPKFWLAKRPGQLSRRIVKNQHYADRSSLWIASHLSRSPGEEARVDLIPGFGRSRTDKSSTRVTVTRPRNRFAA
jgi:hypothetical protein